MTLPLPRMAPPVHEGRPEEQASCELLLDEVEEAVALGHRRVPHKIPGVERREVAVAQVPPVRLRLGVGVAGELERGFREDGGGRQGRPGQEGLDHGRRHVGAHQGLEARVGADREVPLVGQRLGQEARAGDGIVDLRLGSRAGPILGERGRELRVQLGAGIKPKQLVGHVALRLGLRVVIPEIHVSQCIGDLLIDFGPGVEVQQSRDDLGIDLGAVVVAGKGRGDGRGHRAAGGVVGQLARHVGRDLRLVPVGRQGRGDECLDLRFVLELGQVQGVDGCGDRCARFRLRVSLAASVAVRLYQDGVVQVLKGGGQCAGHRQVPQDVAGPEQVEGRPAVPALAVAQRDGRQRRRDGCVPLGRRPVGHQRRRDCGVRLSGVVKTREGCRDCGVPLGHRPVGHQRVGDGLVHLDRGAVGHQRRRDCGVRLSGVVKTREGCRDCGVPLGRCFEGHQRVGDGLGHLSRGAILGELGVRVALGLVDGRHDGGGDFGSREVICQGRGDGVVGLLRGVRIAAEAEGPVVVGELDAQGARGVEVADLVGPGQQVPGHVPQPGGGVDQVGGAAQCGDLRQDAVDGGLQGDLQVAEVSCRGEGPGVLEGEDLRVVSVEAGVLQGLSGLVGRLGQVRQERSRDSLIYVGRGLPSGQVDGQLVNHGLQRISCCYAGQSGVVGGSDATVHRCSGRVIGQLQVHGGRCALSVDFDLEGVQGGLVGLGRQALSQAGVDSHEAGSIGQDGSLCCGEVCSQSVGG